MAVIVWITLGAWGVTELTLRVRERRGGRGGTATDHGTRVLIGLTLVPAIVIAARLSHPGARLWPGSRVVGIGLLWLGIGLRLWAIFTLGDSFRTSVEVHQGQRVIETGPYRWIRHPSYTGLILALAGIGVTEGTWGSLAVAILLPLPALLRRIFVEEAVLVDTLGGPYARYRSHTKRLIPRVW